MIMSFDASGSVDSITEDIKSQLLIFAQFYFNFLFMRFLGVNIPDEKAVKISLTYVFGQTNPSESTEHNAQTKDITNVE